MENLIEQQNIENRIFTVHGVQVMMDTYLAELYAVEIRTLNQAVKRNSERFPEEFMFQLNKQEWDFLRSQIVILKTDKALRSQFATLSKKKTKLKVPN